MKLTKPRRGAKRHTADFMLACFCEATGASKSSVIADAVIAKINEHLRANHGDRERYKEARAKLLAGECAPQLRVVK